VIVVLAVMLIDNGLVCWLFEGDNKDNDVGKEKFDDNIFI
jgi:hypothetical protein